MSGLIMLANDWAVTWCDAMLHATWIGSFAILAAWAITSLFPQTPIIARSWLWRLVYLKLVVVLFWSVPIELPFLSPNVGNGVAIIRTKPTETRAVRTGTIESKPGTIVGDRDMVLPTESVDVSLSVSFWLFVCWVGGALACAGFVARNWIGMKRLCAACSSADSSRLNNLHGELCDQLGCRVRPRLITTSAAVSPQLVGIFRPCIIVPKSLALTDAAGIRMILAHELAHWKRKDLLWNWLPTLVGSLFYFHPAVWLAQREWRLAQELACDESAIQVAKTRPEAYGRMLLEIAKMCRSSLQPSLLSIGVGQSFRGLSLRILAMKTYRAPSRIRIMSAVALLAIVAVLGLVPWKLTAREIATASAGDESAKNTGTEAKATSNIATTTKFGGRIYASVALQSQDEDGNRLIAIDPNTGKWEKLAVQGNSLRVSRDGAAIAFENVVWEKEDKIWVWDLKGAVKPRALGDVICGRPVWSPDGKEIVVSNQKTNDEWQKSKPKKPVWTDETWKFSVDGLQKKLMLVPDTDAVEDWSPDGKWFLTCSDRNRPIGDGYQLYLISPDGAEQRRLTQGRGLNVYGRFSPDGKRIVYTHQEREKTSIRTMTLADRKETVIIEQDGAKAVDAASWSPDGKYVAVSRFDWQVGSDGKFFRTADHDANYRFEIVGLDGKVQRKIKLEGVRFLNDADWK